MKVVAYLGERVNLGRFGEVKRGAEIHLYEWEWDSVSGSPEFKLKGPTFTEAEAREARKIKPYGTPGFDLRTIPWERPNLYKIFLARFKKRRLLAVIAAMEFVGAVIRPQSNADPRLEVVDAIMEAIRAMGWDQMSQEARWKLPVLSQAPEADAGLDSAGEQVESAQATPTPRRRQRR